MTRTIRYSPLAVLLGAGLLSTPAPAASERNGVNDDFVFSSFDPPGSVLTWPQGINDADEISGAFRDARGEHGFLLRRGEVTVIDYPGAAWTHARGINAQEDIVGDLRAAGPALCSRLTREPVLLWLSEIQHRAAHRSPLSGPPVRDPPTHHLYRSRPTVANGPDASFNPRPSRRIIMPTIRIRNSGWKLVAWSPGLVSLFVALSPSLMAQQFAPGTFTTFNFPGAGYTQARYLNASGEIVGFYFEGPAFASPVHGLVRTKDGELTRVDFPGTNGSTFVTGINSEGDIAGFYGVGATTHGFVRDKNGDFSSLDFPGATGTQAWGINSSGNVVGAYDVGGTTHGFLRNKKGDSTVVDFPGATYTQCFGINSEGDIVGQYGAGGTTHGFLRNKYGRITSFDIPGAINTAAGTQTRGISDRGDIVGWFVTSGGRRRGYLLRQGHFTFIDCPTSTSTDSDGINSEGDIVGGCVDAEGHHAYVLIR